MGERPKRLYVVTRRDLPPLTCAVQSCHAAIQFCHDHPSEETEWFKTSNHLVILGVDDELALTELYRRAEWDNLKVSAFREPDLGDQLTAIALEPGKRSSRFCRRLPLIR
jgi:peptidyl-tRNA hydrolase